MGERLEAIGILSLLLLAGCETGGRFAGAKGGIGHKTGGTEEDGGESESLPPDKPVPVSGSFLTVDCGATREPPTAPDRETIGCALIDVETGAKYDGAAVQLRSIKLYAPDGSVTSGELVESDPEPRFHALFSVLRGALASAARLAADGVVGDLDFSTVTSTPGRFGKLLGLPVPLPSPLEPQPESGPEPLDAFITSGSRGYEALDDGDPDTSWSPNLADALPGQFFFDLNGSYRVATIMLYMKGIPGKQVHLSASFSGSNASIQSTAFSLTGGYDQFEWPVEDSGPYELLKLEITGTDDAAVSIYEIELYSK